MHVPWSTLPWSPAPSWLVPLVVCACVFASAKEVSVELLRRAEGVEMGEQVTLSASWVVKAPSLVVAGSVVHVSGVRHCWRDAAVSHCRRRRR